MDQIQQQVKGAGLLRQQRLTQLQTELQPWINDWEMIGRRLAPQHGRWLNDANQRNRPRTSESIGTRAAITASLESAPDRKRVMRIGMVSSRRAAGTLANDTGIASFTPST